jgi:hypothetical protein
VIKDAELLPHLVRELPEPVLDALDRVLVEKLGRSTAGEILGAFDEEVADLPRRAELRAELERDVEAVKRAKDAVLATLAGTTGLEWRPWRRGHYVVTLDGQHIGDVNPRTTILSDPPRYKNFVGRARGTFADTVECKSVRAAAQQVGLAYAKAHDLPDSARPS